MSGQLSYAGRAGRNALLLAGAPLGLFSASIAQASDQETPTVLSQDEIGLAPSTDETIPASASSRESYPAAYFERFAPRNALDMLNQLPGFDVSGDDDSGGSQRGFGQASANVLIDGERLTSKSTSASDQLSRIPAANVIRIDIVDGASLDIPGLSGQVANVILAQSGGVSGQFEWKPTHRFVTNMTNYFSGSVSVTGRSGPVDYTLALENDGERFGAKGPTTIFDGAGELVETRETLFRFFSDRPTATADFRFEAGDNIVANLNLSYFERWSKSRENDTRDFVVDVDRGQIRRFDSDTFDYEIAGDLAFPLGPGQLKLIALESFNRRDFSEQAILSFVDGRDNTGRRFAAVSDTGERIARAEYTWPMLGLDWQASGEAAFNRLDRESDFKVLDPSGEFVDVPLPGATGRVREDRYDFALSAGGALNDKLSFQLTAGAEFSTITDLAENGLERSFRRPKGSALLAWSPSDGWDISLEIARRVGQLDFTDFLASVSIGDDQQTSANARLVPQQSWETELEISRNLGAWGNATVTLFDNRISDFIDIILLPDGTGARGNIESARVRGISINSTLELAPLGFRGARLDIETAWEDSELTDPLDGETRSLSRRTPERIELEFRHDIPNSDWAWGMSRNESPSGRYFRVDEVGREFSGPSFTGVFVEHKDLAGLTVRSELSNIEGPRRRLERTVFDGLRSDGVVDFTEVRRQRIGIGVNFSVSGNF